MSVGTRLQPKQPTGWFAAGREVECALQLYGRGSSLIQVERAILLDSMRKYFALLQNGRGTSIISLHYKAAKIDKIFEHHPIRGGPYDDKNGDEMMNRPPPTS